MRYFKKAGFVIVTMVLMFLTSYNGSVTYIPETIAAQSANQESERIAREAAEAAKRTRQEAEAAREQKRKEDEAAAERARIEKEAAAERKRKEDEAAAERTRIEAEERARREAEAAERARIEKEAAAERARIEDEAAAERARIEKEAAAEAARKKAEASLSLNMVFVQGGTFTMGCTPEQGKDCNKNEKPAHQVTLSDFYIGKYEVTEAQWQMVMGKLPPSQSTNHGSQGGYNLPLGGVNWNDVQAFIIRLNEMTGGNYRLPTEAEWEYAARGGNQSRGYKYSGSDNSKDVVGHETFVQPSIGKKNPNELGIYDMSGNVGNLRKP